MINSISATNGSGFETGAVESSVAKSLKNKKADDNPQLKDAFNSFVGETFFGQMLKSMRQTVGKPSYFYGGRAEEMFQQQLDQTLAQEMTKASGDKFSGPMYDLFSLQRR